MESLLYSGLKNIALFYIFTISFGFSQDWKLVWSDEFNGPAGPISSVHWFHQTQFTAIVGGDSLVLERTDFSARIAYVDYDGAKVYQNYLNNKPKSSSERIEFVKNNAPKIVAGIEMIGKFFEDLKKEPLRDLQIQKSLTVPSS